MMGNKFYKFLFPDSVRGGNKLSWWLCCLLLLPIVRISILVRRRAEGSYSSVDGYALLDIIFVGLCLCIILKKMRFINWSLMRRTGFGWIVAYYFFSLFSVFWRIPGTSMPYIIFRAGSMAVMVLYAYCFMSHFSSRETAFIGLLNYIAVILGLTFYRSLRVGDFHTNTYSVVAGVLVCLALSAAQVGIYSFSDMKYYIAWGGLCLVAGTSSGSNVAFIMALSFIFSCSPKGFKWGRFILLALLSYLLYLLAFETIVGLIFPNKSLESLSGMTGRTKIWEIYINAWKSNPWLGLGFAVGERSGSMFGYIYTLSTHNGFLSILVNTGIVGCIFWARFLIRLGLSILSHITAGSRYSFPVAAAMVMIVVNNMTTPVIGSIYNALSMMVMLLISFYTIWESAPISHNRIIVNLGYVTY